MAVVSVKQTGAGRVGNGKSDFNRTYKVTWVIVVDDPYDGPCTIGQRPEFPLRYGLYDGYENTSDFAALCTSLDIEQDGDEWQKWRAAATFETNWNQDQHQREHPEDEPTIRWVEVEFEKKTVTKEYNGADIRNSAGQLIAGLERDDCVGVYCFERNELGINSNIKTLNNTVNSQPFYDLLPGEGLMRITSGKPEYRNGVPYFKHLYRVRVNPDTWEVQPADRGTLVKGADGKLTVPVDNINQPIDGEVNLDGTGRQLPPTQPIFYLPKKKLYRPASWGPLGL